MNKYILTVLGKIQEEQCPDIVLTLGDVIDSEHVKFIYNENSFILCFGSGVEKNNLFCFITDVLFDITETFILSDVTNEMFVSLPKSMKGFILDLEKSEEIEFNVGIDIIEEYYEEEEDSHLMKLLNKNLKKTDKRPTLDFLLDKISCEGIVSLSETEKKFLDEYSKI